MSCGEFRDSENMTPCLKMGVNQLGPGQRVERVWGDLGVGEGKSGTEGTLGGENGENGNLRKSFIQKELQRIERECCL